MKTLVELSEAARLCSNVDYRAAARAAVQGVVNAIGIFNQGYSAERLQALNGAWAHAARVLKDMPPEGAPAPVSGSGEPARLAA